MKLKAHQIGEATVFVNEAQIKEAGTLEAAAEKHFSNHKPIEKMKPKPAKAKVSKPSGDKPE